MPRRSRLHRQLADGLRTAIRTGRLAPHTRMPSTPCARRRPRCLPTARRRRLQPAGRRGLPVEQTRFRAPGSPPSTRRAHRTTRIRRDAYDVDFLPGSPDLGSFPRTAWLRALRPGLAEIGSDSFGYVDPQGLPAARAAIADYLRRTRGVQADAAAHRALLGSDAGDRAPRARRCSDDDLPLAMEDPGFWLHRMVLQHNGIEPFAVPVDDDGLDVAALADSGARDRADHARAPVADRRGAVGRPTHRAAWIGRAPVTW